MASGMQPYLAELMFSAFSTEPRNDEGQCGATGIFVKRSKQEFSKGINE
jgi:hypothetical protein